MAAGDIPPIGEVTHQRPRFECQLDVDLRWPESDFYEVTVDGSPTIGDPWSVAQTFTADEVRGGLTITVE